MKKNLLVIVCLLFLSTLSFGATNLDLEERVAALESQLDALKRDSISDCRLDLRYYSIRTNNCPFDSVVKEVFPLRGSTSIRVTCYRYELTCRRAGVLETIPVTVNHVE